MPKPLAFSEMPMLDKLGSLVRGGALQFKHWSASDAHGRYPESALRRFQSELKSPRIDRNEVDRALNYGGGYDFGSRDVPIKDAVDMARAYQLWDYMTTFDPKREADAQADYDENVAGVFAANADKELGRELSQKERDRKALTWAKDSYASGGTVKSNLQRYIETYPQRKRQADRAASVMSQADEAGWQPEYQREPALEPPMISPDDLLGSGIPTKLAMLAKAGLSKGALSALGAGVIKNKGGNWLSGSVEGALSGLKKKAGAYSKPANEVLAEMNNIYTPEVISRLSPESRAHVEKSFAELVRPSSLNNWIDRQLTKYVRNEMATPEDPVRALAERGVLHFPARERVAGPVVTRDRLAASFPEEGMAQSQLAKNWEDISDKAIWSDKVGNIPYTDQLPDWIKKLKVEKPSAIHHTMNRGIANDDLGFNHLIDELSNAINPESGLPRHLQLDPKSLERVSVPQAVERVHGINLWRAAMKAEADQAKANNAATVLHKEYPEKGMKWVELKQPKQLPEGYQVIEEPQGYAIIDAKGNNVLDGWANTSEDALADFTDVKGTEQLADALKYEGDTMGHCVGGYCDDVASGRSRIYSLRDAKGQPHVTVEVAPYGSHNDDIMFAELTDKLGRQPTSEELAEAMSVAPQRIVQIKGKQNRAPNPEYLPMVQDFVKSGKWSDVGDLQNTGLRRSRDVWNDMEQQRIREAGKEFGEYLSPEELKAINSEVWPGDSTYNFAQGGPVSPNKTLTLQDLSAIISALESGNQHA